MVAIFTKFDLFVEDQLLELMGNEDILDEDIEQEMEKQADEIALDKFEQHFKSVLLQKQCPPRAVIALSDGT